MQISSCMQRLHLCYKTMFKHLIKALGDTIDGGAPLHSPVMPTPNHAGAPSYNGFHRAVTPGVLQDGEV